VANRVFPATRRMVLCARAVCQNLAGVQGSFLAANTCRRSSQKTGRSLAHRTEFPGIRLMPNHTAKSVDPISKSVLVRSDVGGDVKLGYDKLLIATGARPVQPPIEGRNLAGVFPLHTMENSFAVHRFPEERQPKSAIIVGGEVAGQLIQEGQEPRLLVRNPVLGSRNS
jgi:Pyridine nucleotide-disulphide oxidoreductase